MATVAGPVVMQHEADFDQHSKRGVVFGREKGFASVASVEGVVQASPSEVFTALTRQDVPPSLRTVKERKKYNLLKTNVAQGIKLYDAEYTADFRVPGGYTWQGTINFHIEQDRPRNCVTMRLARPGFLQRLEISFNMRDLNNGTTAVLVQQKLKPSIPTWDPVSRQVVRNINRGLLLDTLTDTILHVERVKHMPPPEQEADRSNGIPSLNLRLPAQFKLPPNFPSNFKLPRLPALGSKLALPWPAAI